MPWTLHLGFPARRSAADAALRGTARFRGVRCSDQGSGQPSLVSYTELWCRFAGAWLGYSEPFWPVRQKASREPGSLSS